MRGSFAVLVVALSQACSAQQADLRVATFNIEDVRSSDLARGDQPRLHAIAEIIQRLRPSVILLNEIAYDHPGVDGVPEGAEPGRNAQQFVDHYLSQSRFEGVEPIRYRAYMWPSNTGLHSGFDLDNDGSITGTYEQPALSDAAGKPSPQTDLGRAYGNDAWGFGTFPGQYAMAILVDERLEVLTDRVRTFRLLPWDFMPAHHGPIDPATGQPWNSAEEWRSLRLSSKSHWDVPVRTPGGEVVHFLCSHPTPPAFDGPEERNKRRNYDELRFWGDYLSEQGYIVDDTGEPGGLNRGAHFVILGDLNADPARPGWKRNAMMDQILSHPRVADDPMPRSDVEIEGLDPTDTATWGKRVDYVLPSRSLRLVRTGVWRPRPEAPGAFPSDHFPVWAEIAVPRP